MPDTAARPAGTRATGALPNRRLASPTSWLTAAVLPLALAFGGCQPPPTPPSLPVAGGGLRGALGDGDAGGFALADRPIDFVFPQDHGPHPTFRSEWWYLTGVLATAAGRRFGVQFTLFRQALRPSVGPEQAAGWRTGQAYLGHFAIADVAARRHWHAERLARAHPALASVEVAPFAAHIDGWRLASVGSGFWPLRLHAQTAGRGEAPPLAVDLQLQATRSIVRQGERGLSRKGPDGASYYYSVPRIAAKGTVAVAGTRHQVTGTAWLDREWTTGVLERQYAGWDWFALHLADGRDLMVCQLRRRDGIRSGYDFGALTDAAGATRILGTEDFQLAPTKHWRGWPIEWQLTLQRSAPDTAPETLLIRAAFPDQVMALSVVYWEGVVDVTGASGDAAGSGYMELTGYR